MTDPVYDENNILTLLSLPPTIANAEAIEAGAVQALCDLYDRKVTREEFCNAAGPVLALYGQSQKLWMLYNIKGVFDQDALTEEKFIAADAQMTEIMRKQALTVIEIVKRLKMCATSQDIVH